MARPTAPPGPAFRLVDPERRCFVSPRLDATAAVALAAGREDVVVFVVRAAGDDFRAMRIAGTAEPVLDDGRRGARATRVARALRRRLDGSPLRRRRLALGVAAADLARLAGVAAATVTNYETGRFTPRPRNAGRIERALADLEAGRVPPPPARVGHGALRPRRSAA